MPLPGMMDRRLSVHRAVHVGSSSMNEPIFEWQPLRTVWAQKIHKSEGEQFDQGTKQRYASNSVAFKTWFMSDLRETDKLVCEGTEYNVVGIREIGRREGLEIAAEAQS